MEYKNKLGVIVTTFVLLLIGITLIRPLADDIEDTRVIQDVVNETVAITSTLVTVGHEKITIASEVGVTLFAEIQNITFFGNDTYNTTAAQDAPIGIRVNITSRSGEIIASDLNFSDGDYNITYTYRTSATGSAANDGILSVSSFSNDTIGTDMDTVEITDEVNWTKAGVVTVNSYNFTDGNYNMSYQYGGTNYVDNSTAQSILVLILIFFAIGIVAIGIVLVRNSFSDMF